MAERVNSICDNVLGDPEVTAYLYCNFAYPYCLRDLQYIFAVTSGSPSIHQGKEIICTEASRLERCGAEGSSAGWFG